MLGPLLDGVLLGELADEAGVPQLRGDAEVLAAPHQRVRLGPFGRGGYPLLVEVLLLAARLGYESGFGGGGLVTRLSWGVCGKKERGGEGGRRTFPARSAHTRA